MDKNKSASELKKWAKLISIVCAITFVLGPLFINIMYKIHAPFEIFRAEWDAGAAIGLFAAVSAALIAIYGISITVNASNEDRREQIRNQVLPFITVEFVRTKPKRQEWFSDTVTEILPDPSTDEYEEYNLRSFFFIIRNNHISAERDLSGWQQTIVQTGGLIKRALNDCSYATSAEPFIYVRIIIRNVGNGPAVHTRVGLNKRTTKKDEREYVMPVPLIVGETMSIGIYSDGLSESSPELGEYDFELLYYDIYGNKYKQDHSITITFDKDNNTPVAGITTEQTQTLISLYGKMKN